MRLSREDRVALVACAGCEEGRRGEGAGRGAALQRPQLTSRPVGNRLDRSRRGNAPGKEVGIFQLDPGSKVALSHARGEERSDGYRRVRAVFQLVRSSSCDQGLLSLPLKTHGVRPPKGDPARVHAAADVGGKPVAEAGEVCQRLVRAEKAAEVLVGHVRGRVARPKVPVLQRDDHGLVLGGEVVDKGAVAHGAWREGALASDVEEDGRTFRGECELCCSLSVVTVHLFFKPPTWTTPVGRVAVEALAPPRLGGEGVDGWERRAGRVELR